MGTSAYEQYLAEKSDPESAYAKYLAEKPQPKKPLSSGELERLRKSTALLNKIEFANAAEGEPGYLDRLGVMAERGASAMGPLGRAIPTAVNYAVNKVTDNPITWDEAAATNAQDIATAGENAPGVNIPLLGRVTLADLPAGAFAFGKYMKAMPGLSVPQIGALFAGGSRATAPEGESAVSRAAGTAGHAIAGAVIPKVVGGLLEVPRLGSAWWRSASAKSVDRNVVGRDLEMNAVGGPLYDMFTALGNLPRTKKLDSVLGSDLVQETLARIRKNDPSLNNVPDTNAQLLHQLYREIGNKAFNAQHGVDPAPLRNSLASALDEAASKLGGSYATPLAVWRRGNQGIDAVIRGKKTLRNAANDRTADTKLLDESPAALERDYGANGNPLGIERAAATEGILGELRSQPKVVRRGVLPMPSRTLLAAPDLLNIAESGGVSGYGTVAAMLRGKLNAPLSAGTTSTSVPTSPPPPPQAPSPLLLNRGPIPMGSGAPPMIAAPSTPMPKLLASESRWAKWSGPQKVGKNVTPEPSGVMGPSEGPPIPMRGRLSDDEMLRRAILWAMEQARGR